MHRGDPSARRRHQLTIKQCSPQPAAPWADSGGVFPAGCGKGSFPTTQICCCISCTNNTACRLLLDSIRSQDPCFFSSCNGIGGRCGTTSTGVHVTCWSLHSWQLRPLTARKTLIRFLSSTLSFLLFSMAGLPLISPPPLSFASFNCPQLPLLLGVSYGTHLPFPTYFSFKPKIWGVTPCHWDSSSEILIKMVISAVIISLCAQHSPRDIFTDVRKPETQHSKGPCHYKMLSEKKKKQLGILQNLSLKLVWHVSDRRNVWSTSVLVFDGSGITWL